MKIRKRLDFKVAEFLVTPFIYTVIMYALAALVYFLLVKPNISGLI